MSVDPSDSGPFKGALGACRSSLGIAAVFSAIVNVLALVAPVYTMQVFDRVLTSRSSETLVYLSLMALVGLATLALLDLARSMILARVGAFLERRLAPTAIRRSLENSLRDQPRNSDAVQDLSQVRQFLGGNAICAMFDLPWLPIYVIVAWMVHPVMGQLAVAGAATLFLVAVLNEIAVRDPAKRAMQASRRMMRSVNTSFRNAEVVDAMGMHAPLMARWSDQIDEQQRWDRSAGNRANTAVTMSKFLRMALQIVLMASGAWLVIHQEMTAGAMMAGSIIVARALQPVEQTIGVWKHAMSAREAFRRLKAFFAEPPLRRETMPLPAPRGELGVENVSYAHAANKDAMALSNVSFALPAGQSMAVIGPSGSGKSTLMRLLVGVALPRRGFVRLDGADMFAWDRAQIGGHVGYLPQDVELFAGTVRQNIARMTDGDPDAVAAAAKLAGVHELILRLPKGYETQIGEGGARLSAGERQRIGLARALYGKPRLVVLDEPDSNLDTDGEASLINAIRALKDEGVTIVATTHRPNLVEALDYVLGLRAGKVTMYGPRQAVLAQLAAGRPTHALPGRGGPVPIGVSELRARRGAAAG